MTFILSPIMVLKLYRRLKNYHITRTFLQPAPTTACRKINTLPAGNRLEIMVHEIHVFHHKVYTCYRLNLISGQNDFNLG